MIAGIELLAFFLTYLAADPIPFLVGSATSLGVILLDVDAHLNKKTIIRREVDFIENL
jgi:hypothetical protein